MVSRKNIQYKRQQDAKRVPHYGIRKLSIGVASVLLSTVVYMQNGSTVHADVNPAVSAGNGNVKVAGENVGVGYSAETSSLANSVASADSASSVVATGGATDSMATSATSQVSATLVDGATQSANNAVSAVGEPGSAAPAGQINAGTDNPNVLVPNWQASAAGNLSGEYLSDNLSLSLKQNLNFNPASLLASKVASTGISNNAVNGGFDEATWGKLDVNVWQGHVQGDYYQLTAYTGDVNHVIVPNEADFAKAGISTSGKQVGVTSDLMHTIFRDKTTAQDATVAFSKTDNKVIKAINADWKDTWGHQYSYSYAKLSKFDGTNLDVSNVTDMSYMFRGNRISNLSPLANWNVNNVTNMSWMFSDNKISDLSPLSNWKVDNVSDMSGMFDENQISDLDPLANWDVSDVTNMSNMFNINQISNLSPLAHWNVSSVINMFEMFCINSISDLSPLANWNITKVTDLGYMFVGNQISDLSPLVNWKVDNVENMSNIFQRNQIKDLSPLANWHVNNVTDMSGMFKNNQISDLSSLANWKTNHVTGMGEMFVGNQISDLSPLAKWNVDNVKNMSSLFEENQISDLSPLANWHTNNVIAMNNMFHKNQISDLTPLSNWKVDNVKDMSYMFSDNKISSLSPLANWNVDNVQGMSSLFEENQISDLTPLAGWHTNNVGMFDGMFANNRIGDVSPLANWNTDHTSAIYGIFDNNSSIQTKTTPAKRIINFVYPAGYTGKKQNSITQTIDVPTEKVKVELTTNEATTSYKISDWVTKTETPISKITDSAYFQDYTVPAIKGLLEPDKSVISKQQADIIKPINVTVTYKLLESNTNDAFALDSKNGLHEHADVNDNGGYDTDFWGTLDVSKFTTVKNGDNLEITGYNGDASKVIIPNIADFEINNLDQGAKQVTISSSVMRQLAKNATRIGLSKTNNQKVVAGDAIWQDAFGGGTNNPGTGDNADGGMWVYNPNLTVMDLHNLDTTNITYMSSMFNGGRNLKVVGDLSQWNVANVVDMRDMFQTASLVTNIGNLNNWNTSKVIDMTSMFGKASKLANIGDLSKWDVSKVTNMHAMFGLASSLVNIGNLSNWDTSKVTDMSFMFNQTSKLENIGDLSKWDVSKVTNMSAMFQAASSLTNIGDLDSWDTAKVTDMSYMFNQASNLTNIGNLSNWNTAKVTDMSFMFNQASNLTNIGDLSKWDVANVTNMKAMFQLALSLTNIGNLDNWNTAKVTDMSYMFKQASNLTNIGDLSKWDVANVTDMSFMFNQASKLTNIGDLSKWNVANVTDMIAMFELTSSLTNIGNLDNWNTAKVTDMSFMFNQAFNLTNIGDLSSWNVANVINMHAMFQAAASLTNIGNLDNWNTSKVIDMGFMFNQASKLTNIGDLSKWDVANVTNMAGMFQTASLLTNIGDLDNWNTSKVTDMSYMFYNAIHLTNIGDLSKWQTGNVTNMMWMFVSTYALRYLNISNWNLTKLANKDAMKYMFANDTDLTIIANDLALPVWYQNEINDADYFWNHHIAVITNVPELIKSTGDVDNLKIDDQDASRSIFYDSKGSSDAIQVLKQANQAYVKQYQNEHPGYTLNLAADVDQTDSLALANARFVSVPREVQFTIAYYDLTGKLVDATTSTHKVGETVSIVPVAPANYVLVSGQSSTDRLMQWGLNEADFLVEPKVTTTTQTKTVSRTIKVQTPDGRTKNVVQTVKFVRNGYLNQVTKETTYSPWSFGGQYQFSSYQPKPIDGYTADVIPAVVVTPDSSDTMLSLTYHKQTVVYSVAYQLANGTVVKKVSVTPASNGIMHLTAPQGYRLLTPVTDMQVGHSSQKLVVFVVSDEHTYTAKDTLPSGVKEPLTKAVTRKVIITMPNGHVRTVTQTVRFERTATVDSAGHVTYGNWQAIGRAQFNKVFVAKRHGYHLVIMSASGKTLPGVDKIDNVTAAMSDEVVNVKYVKD